ncbi:MAG TPA: hypothetical protein VMY42_14570 [Thermoguttaceae bacterium]|nr:hypothetical protein [Thermoguttaceae bacterium]
MTPDLPGSFVLGCAAKVQQQTLLSAQTVSKTVAPDGAFAGNLRADCSALAWIDLAVPCLDDYPIPSNNYFREKHRRCEDEEAKNIRQYLARPR